MCKQIDGALLLEQDDYKPGDPAPEGYLERHEWAKVQHKAGLRQEKCGLCGKWNYPQELSDQWNRRTFDTRKWPVMQTTRACLECAQNANLTGMTG